MGPEVWGPVAAAVSALVLFAIKLYSAKAEKERKADNAISKRDRDELERGMSAIDGMRGNEPVPAGSEARVQPGRHD